jgi:hypothetical protein
MILGELARFGTWVARLAAGGLANELAAFWLWLAGLAGLAPARHVPVNSLMFSDLAQIPRFRVVFCVTSATSVLERSATSLLESPAFWRFVPERVPLPVGFGFSFAGFSFAGFAFFFESGGLDAA